MCDWHRQITLQHGSATKCVKFLLCDLVVLTNRLHCNCQCEAFINRLAFTMVLIGLKELKTKTELQQTMVNEKTAQLKMITNYFSDFNSSANYTNATFTPAEEYF